MYFWIVRLQTRMPSLRNSPRIRSAHKTSILRRHFLDQRHGLCGYLWFMRSCFRCVFPRELESLAMPVVKEIARGLQGVGMSKLTRLLDQLEDQGYISRSLNLEDRRSFHVSLTEQGKVLYEHLEQQMAALAENIMRALTPIERLLQVELFAKIRANWSAESVEQRTVQHD
jgi:DNA-binding MarR family transcriptional regulator